ncbi:MAG: hypothetical protein ABFC78_02065, partial [Methanoregula sp.]
MTPPADAVSENQPLIQPEEHTRTFRHLGGQVKNTVKDFVSIIRGYSHGAGTAGDSALLRKTKETGGAPEYWKDWRWQVRHAVRDLNTFQQLLGIKFPPA